MTESLTSKEVSYMTFVGVFSCQRASDSQPVGADRNGPVLPRLAEPDSDIYRPLEQNKASCTFVECISRYDISSPWTKHAKVAIPRGDYGVGCAQLHGDAALLERGIVRRCTFPDLTS
jgi:hypothetical protein